MDVVSEVIVDRSRELEGIERMVVAGIRKIVTTPHLDGSLTR